MTTTIPGGKFYDHERVALFIDGANLYAAARSLGFDIDYKKLLELFRESTRLLRAFYYTALVDDQEYSPIRPLVDWLDYNGYAMVTKPTKEFTDASGRRKIKGNMDIELATDVMEIADKVDHVVIFSGDGDFRRLVEAVQRKGVRVSIVSTVRSQPPMAADELRRQADVFLELEALAPAIRRAHAPRALDERRPDERKVVDERRPPDRRSAREPLEEDEEDDDYEYDDDDDEFDDDDEDDTNDKR
ncbi:MAG: NYN domain-containing protein [Alphaproteobacteria bacterium]